MQHTYTVTGIDVDASLAIRSHGMDDVDCRWARG